jgi:hypothetical protein
MMMTLTKTTRIMIHIGRVGQKNFKVGLADQKERKEDQKEDQRTRTNVGTKMRSSGRK